MTVALCEPTLHCTVPEGTLSRVNKSITYFALYAALYGAFGVASPYWPQFLETRGLSAPQIAQIFGAALLIRLISGPLVGALADMLAAPKVALAVCAVSSAGAALALLGAHTFWSLLILILVQAAALAPTTSIADSLSVNRSSPQSAGARPEYGWIRGAGSAAFAGGTLIMGQLITPHDLTPVIWMNAALLLVAGGATALLPMPAQRPEPSIRRSLNISELGRLLHIARFRTLVLVAALVFGSHAMNDTFAVIRWSGAGIGASTISFLWSEGVAAEVIVFFLIGPMLLNRLGERRAATLAVTAAIARWTVESATNSVLALSILQPLHGLTFALLHLACMRMMGVCVPPNIAATAQSAYGFASGLVTAGVTLCSGFLYARYGGSAFLPMAALCAIALPFAWFGLR
jgi:MFS transporter, PPP family, 3-phenylpropionic acid transporter